MTGDRRVTRAVVATVLVLITAGAALGTAVAAAFLWGGVFNVAANDHHWPPVRWALERTLASSVSAYSDQIIAPGVGPERISAETLKTYSSECAVCHGAPGRDRPQMAQNMRPEPPALAEFPLGWSPSERFWIVKNGIKMSGMPAWGPVIADEKIWDLVALTIALPDMSQQEYIERMQGEVDGAARAGEAPGGGKQEIAAAPQQAGDQPADRQEPEPPRKQKSAEAPEDGQQQTAGAPQEAGDKAAGRQEAKADEENTGEAPEDGQQQTTDQQASALTATRKTAAAENGDQTGGAAAAQESEQEPPARQDGEGGVAATIEMTGDLTFRPSKVTISAGETVLWKNVSEVPHTVTADKSKAKDPSHVHLPEGAEPFNSGFIGPKGTYSRTFTVPGRYQYFCIPHEAQGMIGELIVE